MKQVRKRIPLRILSLLMGLFLTANVFAQQAEVKGNVKDATGEPIIGATVKILGQQGGTVTDFDGNFTITAEQGQTLEISYIGYATQQVSVSNNMSITLQEDAAQSLNEVVVIGYGAVKKSDLTGSVTALKPDSKNKGLVVNPQDAMQGKIAGVNVTSDGGSPGGGATIRIRGGSSLNASNDPLIVIDGVAMDNNGVKGLSNPLSMVNPQDIESFNVLKDASATAIYGSRGSNGVIIITTKKGRKGQKVSVSYNGSLTISHNKKTLDVMDGDQFRSFITNMYGEDSDAYRALGSSNTDWQKEIYRTAVSHDHNVTVAGSVGNILPWRVSLGYTGQQGVLKTSKFDRYTAAVNLNPSLFDDHLNINVNAKGMYAKTRYADNSAISAARWYDPTQSIYDNTSSDAANFAGYHAWKTDGSSLNDSSWPNTLNSLATKNPMAILDLKNDIGRSKSFIGSADADYKIHGFEDLRLHATFGADISEGKQDTDILPSSPLNIYYGNYGWEKILKRNLTFSAYAQYYHDFNDKAKNHIDIMFGGEEQHFWRELNNSYWGYYPLTNNDKTLAGTEYQKTNYTYKTENYIVSYFGRANYSLLDRYYLTATVRADGSSRFKDHWATFPSFAFAWKMSEEKLFRDMTWLSDLKLRLGYGKTGQQDGIGDYNYFTIYQTNTGTDSYYPVTGDGSLARPQAVNKDLTWEKTTTYNIGLDWGVCNQRFTGSIDWYHRKTTDLLNTVYVAAGANFKNQVSSNIGSLKNNGLEIALSWKAIQTKDWFWTIDYNFTYNKNEITQLTASDRSDYYVETGGISSGTGVTCQAHAVGHAASSFFVYQQVYDENGNPLEGVVVDRNGDGVISEADKYFYKSPMAPVTMGLSSRLEYKNWDFGFSLRASLGNYVFNDVMAGASNLSTGEMFRSQYLSNRPTAALSANWQTYNLTSTLSDRWVQNASFLKCDNITLGYSFSNLFGSGNWGGLNGRIYATCSNVFTITKYDGIDPEVFGGIDSTVYPRPISYILGLSLNF